MIWGEYWGSFYMRNNNYKQRQFWVYHIPYWGSITEVKKKKRLKKEKRELKKRREEKEVDKVCNFTIFILSSIIECNI